MISYQARSTVHIDAPYSILKKGFSLDISGNNAFYYDNRSFSFGILNLLNFQVSLIPNNNYDAREGHISGPLAVWHSFPDSTSSMTSKVHIYDLNTNTRKILVDHSGNRASPDIDGNRVVWMDDRNGNWDIYGCIYDSVAGKCSNPVPLTTNPSKQVMPAISGDMVVWQDNRNGNWDIYALHLPSGTEYRLTTDPADQITPAIDGTRVVYMDNRHGQWEVYLYDLSTQKETRISNTSLASMLPRISGLRIVWSEEEKEGPYTVRSKIHYFNVITNQGGLFASGYDNRLLMSVIDGNNVLFSSNIDNQAAGPQDPDLCTQQIP